MSVWTYRGNDNEPERIEAAVKSRSCLYCRTHLEVLRESSEDLSHPKTLSFMSRQRVVRVCPVCGWWTIHESTFGNQGPDEVFGDSGASATLIDLDLADQTIPLKEIRQYLVVNYRARFRIDPAVFENVVASVYRDLGYSVVVTGRRGDGGIDVILEDSRGSKIGVEVKRYKNRIRVTQIRSLLGALMLRGITRGVFVTTSSFQRGAHLAVRRSADLGKPIELVDSQRFYDALRIAQRSQYTSSTDPTAPFAQAHLVRIRSEVRTPDLRF